MKELINSCSKEVHPYSKDQILALEEAIKELPDQVDLEKHTKHYFAPGIYTRELFIPEGTVLTGKIHRHEIMNVLVSGVIQVTTNDGIELLEGPMIFNSKAGTKKAAFTRTDVIWLNIHPTKLTDLEEIEREFIAPSFEALEQEKTLCLGLQ
jgi:hypothetical protein